MLFGHPQLYEQTRAAKLGRRALPKPLEELRRWVSEEFGINVLNVGYDRIEIGPHQGRPRLNLIVNSAEDYAKRTRTTGSLLIPASRKPFLGDSQG